MNRQRSRRASSATPLPRSARNLAAKSNGFSPGEIGGQILLAAALQWSIILVSTLPGVARPPMSFRFLQLLFPVLVALHNAEEAIRMPHWTRRSGIWFGRAQPGLFRFVVVLFTLLAVVVTLLSVIRGPRTLCAGLTFGFIVALFLNALVPHIAVSLARRTLMPGVVTAAALNLPILPLLALLALRQGYVSNRAALLSSILVPLALLLMIPLLFRLGRALGF